MFVICESPTCWIPYARIVSLGQRWCHYSVIGDVSVNVHTFSLSTLNSPIKPDVLQCVVNILPIFSRSLLSLESPAHVLGTSAENTATLLSEVEESSWNFQAVDY